MTITDLFLIALMIPVAIIVLLIGVRIILELLILAMHIVMAPFQVAGAILDWALERWPHKQ